MQSASTHINDVNPIRLQEKIVAVLHALLGLFLLIGVALIWRAAAELATWFAGSFIPELLAWIGRPIGIFLILVAVAQMAAALGLVMRQGWARVVLIAASAALLLLFPVGTLLAAYTFFVLLWLPRNEGTTSTAVVKVP